jgi:hypothetical protein
MRISAGPWGGWTIDTQAETIEFEDGPYVIDLTQIRSGAMFADRVFQVRGKSWATRVVVGGFVDAIHDLWDGAEQPLMCPGGTNREIPLTKLREYLMRLERRWLNGFHS